MNRDMSDWQEKTLPRLENRIVALVAEAVWPGTSTLPAPLQAFRFGSVRDVLDGYPTPVLSQKDRQAILDAAGPILAGARP